MNQPLQQIEHKLCGFPAARLLCCMLLLIPPAGLAAGNAVDAAAPANAAPATELTADSDDLEDIEDIEDSEDGSAALGDTSRRIGTNVLLPISADEEQSLLGDWGDSENED